MNSERMISAEEARSFLVNYHNLNRSRDWNGIDGVMQCFGQIKSIQYDPLDVVGRNADLVLQARVSGYESSMLSKLLYSQHKLVDGFDKEMCIYAADEFPYFSRVREAWGEKTKDTLGHRGQLDALHILDEVRDHIRQHGTTSSKDISIGASGRKGKWGHRKLSSAALDYLYCTGELSVKDKKGVQKYYDFTEHVVPAEILAQKDFGSDEEFLEWYIKRRIQSTGLLWNKRGGAWQGHFLSDNKKRQEVLEHLVHKGELQSVDIEGIEVPFYFPCGTEQFFDNHPKKSRVRFLAPLDNMLWDRELVSKIFRFNYSWEVYIPVEKRKYGYYVLPVLYGNHLIARFEPERCKKEEPFTIKNWWWEHGVTVTDEMLAQIHQSIQEFARYLSVPYLENYTTVIMKEKI